MFKVYIKLLRVKHYSKNLLIFLPIFFGGHFFDFGLLVSSILGFFFFQRARFSSLYY